MRRRTEIRDDIDPVLLDQLEDFIDEFGEPQRQIGEVIDRIVGRTDQLGPTIERLLVALPVAPLP